LLDRSCHPSMRRARAAAVAVAAVLVSATAAAHAQANSTSPLFRVTARASASVTPAHPKRRAKSRRLRVGGRGHWRTLLRFDMHTVGPVARVTLGVWAIRRPRARIVVRAVRSDRSWHERRLTYSHAPRLGDVAGGWKAPRSCRRRGHGHRHGHRCKAGQWLWIDVTTAVGSRRRVSLALTTKTRRTVRIASRRDPRRAPRLLVQRAAPPPPPAPAPTPPAQPTAGGVCAGSAPPPAYHHVIWVWLENKDYGQVIGSPAAPYVNGLAARCGLATNDHAVTHPSLPNYIAATSGGTQGVTDDGSPSAHPLSAPSIFGQLGASWRSYQESMPASCALTGAGRYAPKHNPAAYFVPVRAACGTADVPLGAPSFDAAFTFVMPDMCNSTHDCPVSTGDAWLAGFIPQVLSSPQYQSGDTLLVITWDESDGTADNHIPAVMVAPSVVPGTQDPTPYTHYSLLRTTEELLGLPLLGAAASAPSMRGGFHLG
jgi:phosphatidylinositol-3-phosphatase